MPASAPKPAPISAPTWSPKGSALAASKSCARYCARASRAISSTTLPTTSCAGSAPQLLARLLLGLVRIELDLDQLLGLYRLAGDERRAVTQLPQRLLRGFLEDAAERLRLDDLHRHDLAFLVDVDARLHHAAQLRYIGLLGENQRATRDRDGRCVDLGVAVIAHARRHGRARLRSAGAQALLAFRLDRLRWRGRARGAGRCILCRLHAPRYQRHLKRRAQAMAPASGRQVDSGQREQVQARGESER